jgi:hypothetical protein
VDGKGRTPEQLASEYGHMCIKSLLKTPNERLANVRETLSRVPGSIGEFNAKLKLLLASAQGFSHSSASSAEQESVFLCMNSFGQAQGEFNWQSLDSVLMRIWHCTKVARAVFSRSRQAAPQAIARQQQSALTRTSTSTSVAATRRARGSQAT